MKNPKTFSPSFLILCSEVRGFLVSGKRYVDDALLLKQNTPTCTPSFHLLSSLAFELLPKGLIGCEVCLKYKDKSKDDISETNIRKEIARKMSDLGHNVKTIYELFPDLMSKAHIERIDQFKNGYMSEYRIKLKGLDYLISVKDIEAARYKSFSKAIDIVTDCTGDNLIIDLLGEITKYVWGKYLKTNSELKKALA